MTRVCSIFSQILQLIPRLEFESAVHRHGAERHARGFSSWGSSSPCSFASWDMPSRCAKYAEAWPPVRENFVIWVCPRLRLRCRELRALDEDAQTRLHMRRQV